MDHWSVSSANMRFLTENTKSSRARRKGKKRKRLKENRLQDSEKERNLSHAAKVSSNRVGMVNPDLAERENTSRAEKVVSSKVVTEIESHGESFVEEEIQEGQENLGGTESRGYRRRKRNKQASIFNYTLTPNCLLTN